MKQDMQKNLTIVLTRSMLAGDVAYIKAGLDKEIDGCYEFVVPAAFTEEELLKLAPRAHVLLGPFVTEQIVASAEQLRLIQVPWTGMDTFNFAAVRDTDVPVCNTHSNADAVAELGVALILDLLKKLSYHDRKMRNGNWNRDQQPLSLTSRMLSKQRVCMLGCGNIGSKLAQLLAAFGATVCGVSQEAPKADCFETVYAEEDMTTAVSDADIVVCALPLTAQTKGMIDTAFIASMKDGAMLVNLSRAEVIAEDAVFEALQAGELGGFAADVWWNTPKRGESASYPSTHNAFWEMDNVVMSPHRAGFVENALPHLDGAIDNMVRLYKGEPLLCTVDRARQY